MSRHVTRALCLITGSNAKDLETDDNAFIYFSVFGTRESTRPGFHDIDLKLKLKLYHYTNF